MQYISYEIYKKDKNLKSLALGLARRQTRLTFLFILHYFLLTSWARILSSEFWLSVLRTVSIEECLILDACKWEMSL